MKKVLKGKVTGREQVTPEVFELRFSSELTEILPGQFLSILCPPKTLRRPFGVAGFENGILRVLIRVKGEGTKYLASLKEGDEIDFLAPLGNNFSLENKKSLLVGAGIGTAPLLYLNCELKKRGIQTLLISGFKSEGEIVQGCDSVKVGGSILDEVQHYINEFKPEKIYSCGPEIVLKMLSQTGMDQNIDVEVAMEKHMACGIGVCRGCVIDVMRNGVKTKASVCVNGPVFKGSEVVW